MKNYFRGIKSQQEKILRPVLEKLDEILLRSAGVQSLDKAWWGFKSLYIESDETQVKNAQGWASVAKTLSETGVISSAQIKLAIEDKFSKEGYLDLKASTQEQL
jgi:hypothetical protein